MKRNPYRRGAAPAAPPPAESPITPKKKYAQYDDAFFAKMRARFLLAQEALEPLHREALIDFKFKAGDQWDPALKTRREAGKRPCYTINRVPEFLRQVTGAQKKARPAIQVSPVGDGADIETAEIEQGLVRAIERNSNADDSKDTAFEHMATGGFGFFRLLTKWSDAKGENNEQEIAFGRENDPFAHYPDPECVTRDYSDSRFWFVERVFTRERFQEEHPDSDFASLTDFSGLAERSADWIRNDAVRVVEYFYVKTDRQEIELTDDATGEKYMRTKETRSVFWVLSNGLEILDERDIPGEFIPIVPVLGEEVIVEGRRQLCGLVRFMRTPAQLYNLWTSAMAETIALAPKSPWLATPQQIEGYEDLWENANNEAYPYLPFNPDKNAPPPQRQFAEPPIRAIQASLAHADNDLKSTTGIYDASLGAPGPEQSGKALLLRQKQGEGATFGFLDAMEPAIKHAGRIIVGWIPHYYDTARVVRVVKPDGTSFTVKINQPYQDDAGLQKVFDLTVGDYDVAITTGPSEDSMRQEAAASILGLVQAQPALINIVGDLLVKCMDWPLADQIAERLHKMLPPQLQDNAQAQVPPAAQAQLAQQGQMIQQLTAVVHKLSAEKEGKTAELASKERIALMNNRAGLVEALIKAGSAEAMMAFQADIANIDRQLAMIPDPAIGHESDMQASQQQHERDMAARQAAAQPLNQLQKGATPTA